MHYGDLSPEAQNYADLLVLCANGKLPEWATRDDIEGVANAAGFGLETFFEHLARMDDDDDIECELTASSETTFRMVADAEVSFSNLGSEVPLLRGVPAT